MWDKLVELDLFNPNKIVGLKNATPAQILEKSFAIVGLYNPTIKT
jgi:hypothetical protein